MIAWTGMEMYESEWESELKCRALRKWSLDADAEDGGVLGLIVGRNGAQLKIDDEDE